MTDPLVLHAANEIAKAKDVDGLSDEDFAIVERVVAICRHHIATAPIIERAQAMYDRANAIEIRRGPSGYADQEGATQAMAEVGELWPEIKAAIDPEKPAA